MSLEAAVTLIPSHRIHEFQQLDELKEIPYGQMRTVDNYVGVSLGDLKALTKLIREIDANHCLELGTFLGNGTTALFYGAGTHLICVDHWKGNAFDPFMQKSAPQSDFYQLCYHNVQTYDRENRIVLFESESKAASEQFPDHSFDLIFIDADHTYEGVLADLHAWYSKVRPGGIICGHDCEGRPKNFPKQDFSLTALRGNDWNDQLKIHPGVIRAVDEFFEGVAELFAEQKLFVNNQPVNSTIWYYRIPN
jgi:predicted O-methyltransferase YrrM